MKNMKSIARYVQLEKKAGRNGNFALALRASRHVDRACRLYGVTHNPY